MEVYDILPFCGVGAEYPLGECPCNYIANIQVGVGSNAPNIPNRSWLIQDIHVLVVPCLVVNSLHLTGFFLVSQPAFSGQKNTSLP